MACCFSAHQLLNSTVLPFPVVLQLATQCFSYIQVFVALAPIAMADALQPQQLRLREAGPGCLQLPLVLSA